MKMGIESPTGYSKYQYKRIVKKYIEKRNKDNLIEMSRRYKKVNTEELEGEGVKRKGYFHTLNIEDARYRFRISSLMVEKIRKNYPRKYKGKPLSCPSCRNLNIPDTQLHILEDCPAFRKERENLDRNNDSELILFFKSVVDQRIKDEDE